MVHTGVFVRRALLAALVIAIVGGGTQPAVAAKPSAEAAAVARVVQEAMGPNYAVRRSSV